MASSQAQAEITERRLRPLYDAIDNRQNKKALQIADKIIKKQEHLFCAKALKAIVCQRMGRQEEGNSLIEEVVKACPGDQATLQATTMYYRETGDEQKVVDLYSRAAEQYPGNQEILTHLFMAFVRVGNYHKQQQTAVLLNKAYPDNGPYYCWRVMSLVMQAYKTNDNRLANTMFLPLAEKLMEKYVVEKKLDIEEEVKLYLLILKKQGKSEKQLDVIRGPLGDLIRKKEDHNRLELDCHMSLQRWDEALVVLTDLLHQNPDQWSDIKHYISCQIQKYKKSIQDAKEDHVREIEKRRMSGEGGGGEGGEEGERGKEEVWEGKGEKEEDKDGVGEMGTEKTNQLNTADSGYNGKIPQTPSSKPLLDARDLLEELCNLHPCRLRGSAGGLAVHPLRGPFLGRLELIKQVTLNGVQNVVELPAPSTLMMDYFNVFATKGCCFDDLRPYLVFFSPDELKRFMVLAEAKVTENKLNCDCSNEDVKHNISIFRRQMSLMKLQRFCGYHRSLSLDKKRELVMLCKHMYREGLKLSRGVPDTDSKPADFFVVLAVHLLMEIYVDTREWKVLWQAILLLEHARSMHSINSQILLLLMRLYGYIGAAEGITDVFETLSIKHLQMETLGYIPLRYLLTSGAFGFANQIYRSALRFYYSCAKETSEYIIQAYKNGVFQKIMEFIDLRDKLSHSLSFACALVDMNLMEVVTSIHSMEKAVQFFGRDWFQGLPTTSSALHDYCAGLVDSRDLTVYDDWSRAATSGNDITSHTKLENRLSAELEVLWLRVRVMLVQCFKDSILNLATTPSSISSTTTSTQDERGGVSKVVVSKAVVLFSAKVGELTKCLAQMAQHIAMLVIQQKKAHLLPLQTSPPCLGFRFLKASYGHTILVMFNVIDSLARGKTDIAEKLNEIIKLLRNSVSVVHCVPDDLKDVVARIVKGRAREGGSRGGEGERERGGDGEGTVKDGVRGEEVNDEAVKTEEREGGGGENGEVNNVKDRGKRNTPHVTLLNSVPSLRVDMEQYSLFISIVSYIVLMCAVCVDIVKPPTPGLSRNKKKNKKKKQRGDSTSSDDGCSDQAHHHHHSKSSHPSIPAIISFMKDLHSLIQDTSRSFRPISSVDRQLINLEEELRECQQPFEDKDFEWTMYPPICKLVLQSYNTSMEDSEEVLDSKMLFLRTLLQDLGAGKSLRT